MVAKYDPQKHNRRSIRLQGWDYTTPTYYFVTICTHQRQHLFDNPAYLAIAQEKWLKIPQTRKGQHIVLDEWVVMPNHDHGLLQIDGERLAQMVANGLVTAPNAEHDRQYGTVQGSIGAVIGSYKRQVTGEINGLRGTKGEAVWQRGYWDRIVRNERELNAIREYIRLNPARWAEDRDNLDGVLEKMTHHE
jgi:REP element-mobilizing transposase RayT